MHKTLLAIDNSLLNLSIAHVVNNRLVIPIPCRIDHISSYQDVGWWYGETDLHEQPYREVLSGECKSGYGVDILAGMVMMAAGE